LGDAKKIVSDVEILTKRESKKRGNVRFFTKPEAGAENINMAGAKKNKKHKGTIPHVYYTI